MKEPALTKMSSLGVAILLTLATVAASATFAVSLVYQFGSLPLALLLLLARPASPGADDAGARLVAAHTR